MIFFLFIEPKTQCLIGGVGHLIFSLHLGVGHLIFNLHLGVGHSVLLLLEGVGHVFSNHHILKCSSPPPPLYFLTSP